MDTRILASLMVIGLVATAMGMGTYAYFSDTETSTGNTFTAGAIDLTVSGGKFELTDVKPGDSGEKTVTFTLTSNPAWACIYVDNIVDSDNGCNEPELVAELGCTESGNGELDEHLYVTVWVDNDCDNMLDTGEEVVVNNVQVSQFIDGKSSIVIPVADNSANSLMSKPLQPGTYCIGISWQVPTTTGNDVQTDKVGADLSFYVEQARNNPGFVCSK